MRVAIYFILILTVSNTVYAQNRIDFDSTRFLVKDKSFINTQRHLEIDKFGNKYIVGFFKDSIKIDTCILYHNSTNYQYSQALFVAKYGLSNNLLFCKKVAEGDTLATFCVDLNATGLLALTYYYKGQLKTKNAVVISSGGSDILLETFDSNLNSIGWQNIGSGNDEWFNNNSLTFGDAGIYFTGNFNLTFSGTYPNYQMIIGNDTLTADDQDIFVAKFDSLCNPIWARAYNTIGTNGSIGLKHHNDALYLTGVTRSMINNNIGGLTFNYPGAFNAKLFIAKLDTLGNGIWVRKFGNEDQFASMGANALAVHGNRVYVGGSGFTNIQNKFHFEGGPTLNGNGASTEYYIASYDTAGTFKWNTIAKNFNEATIASMACDSASNVYVTGKFDTKLQFPTDTLVTTGGQDVFVLSYDSSGTYRWAISGGGISSDRGDDIAMDDKGKPWIVGGTTSANCQFGNYNYSNPWSNAYFMASIDSVGWAVGVSDYALAPIELNLYPNPVYNVLTVVCKNNWKNAALHIVDILGNILSTHQMKSEQLNIDCANYPSGIYFLRYKNEQQSFTRKIIVEH